MKKLEKIDNVWYDYIDTDFILKDILYINCIEVLEPYVLKGTCCTFLQATYF